MPYTKTTDEILRRFGWFLMPDDVDGCWPWQGGKRGRGYGSVRWDGRNQIAHRVVWEYAHGKPFPAGKVAHHTCRQKACCNPAHIRPVTNAENRLLDRREFCEEGHEMTPENRRTDGKCRICFNAWQRAYRRKRRGDKFGVWSDRNRVMV